MKKNLLLSFCLLCFLISSGQVLEFKKSSLKIKEPYEIGKDKTETYELILTVNNLKKSNLLKADPIQVLTGSTYPLDKYKLITKTIDSLKEKNIIEIELTTDTHSDENRFILISINYEDLKDTTRTKNQIKDTLFIENSYPFKATIPKDYSKWNDGKRAEIFIGSNFDFFGENVLTDWYGGTSIFLPGITDFKFHKEKSAETPRWGINSGLYHSRSFSNYGRELPEDFTNIRRRELRRYLDTINNIVRPAIDYQQDTVTVKSTMELNNWGAFAGLMYQFSRFESITENFVTNIFVGAHAEVIRRGVVTSYVFDTIGSQIRTIYDNSIRLGSSAVPKTSRRVYFDSYFGVNMPIQFLWKEIIDLKIVPCFGIGSASYNSSPKTALPGFYLINFDLLARLGGIKLNLGGEVRGYLPNDAPILSAYLGTSFSVSKLVDFITK